MDKTTAHGKIEKHLTALRGVSGSSVSSMAFQKWKRQTRLAIAHVFGEDSNHVNEFDAIRWKPGSYYSSNAEQAFMEAYSRGMSNAQALLESMIEEIVEYWNESDVEPSPDPTVSVEKLCNRFHIVAQQLQARHDNRQPFGIDDEYDVQDLLHALLKLFYDDVRPEEYTPSYAGKSSRMDFLLKDEQTVIETKKTGKSLGEKDVGDQLIIDIERYKPHPDCQRLICFVYDPEGRIRNPIGIENDLTRTHDGLEVRVIVAPKGV